MYVIVGNKSYSLTDAQFYPKEAGKPALLHGHDPHDRFILVEGEDAETLWAAVVAKADVKIHPETAARHDYP